MGRHPAGALCNAHSARGGFFPQSYKFYCTTRWQGASEEEAVLLCTQVEVPILSREDCVGPRTAYRPQEITDRMFCAGDLDEGGIDACAVGGKS